MPFANSTSGDRPNGAQAHAQRSAPNSSPGKTKRLSLALQGGGAFGAFTWGVLDRLLEEDDLALDAVSGASAGAILGFKWSSQHLGRGGCDDRSEAALGSVRARRLALARSALC